MQVYFTDSFSSWQKGAVENTNKLIRQYIPKGTDISSLTDGFIIISAKENQYNTKRKTQILNTQRGAFQTLCVILHLLVDSLSLTKITMYSSASWKKSRNMKIKYEENSFTLSFGVYTIYEFCASKQLSQQRL